MSGIYTRPFHSQRGCLMIAAGVGKYEYDYIRVQRVFLFYTDYPDP